MIKNSGKLKVLDKTKYILEGKFYMKREDSKSLDDLIDMKVQSGCVYGELGSPDKFDISFSRISHAFHDIQFDEKTSTLKVECRVLDTQQGKELKYLIDDIGVGELSMVLRYVKNSNGSVHKIFAIDLDFNVKSSIESLRDERREKIEKINKISYGSL